MKIEFLEKTKNEIHIISTEEFIEKLDLGIAYQFVYELKFENENINKLLEETVFLDSKNIIEQKLCKCFSKNDENEKYFSNYSGYLTVQEWEVLNIECNLKINLNDIYDAEIKEGLITFLPRFSFEVEVNTTSYSTYNEHFKGTFVFQGEAEVFREIEFNFAEIPDEQELKKFITDQPKVIIAESDVEITEFVIDDNIKEFYPYENEEWLDINSQE